MTNGTHTHNIILPHSHFINKRKKSSVRFVRVLWPFQLHLQTFHANLKTVHRLDGCVCGRWIVVADKAWKTTVHNIQEFIRYIYGEMPNSPVRLPKHLL
jgi:hypothetical protein